MRNNMKYSVCSTGNQELLKLAKEPCDYERDVPISKEVASMIQKYMGKRTSPTEKKKTSNKKRTLNLDAGRMII